MIYPSVGNIGRYAVPIRQPNPFGLRNTEGAKPYDNITDPVDNLPGLTKPVPYNQGISIFSSKSTDTALLMRGIVASDTDGSNSVSKTELESNLQKTQGQLQLLEYFNQIYPFNGIIKNMLQQCKNGINALTLVKNNFDSFSSKKINPNSSQYVSYEIQQADLDRIVNSAKKNGNVYDFTKDELADLKAGKKIPNAPYDINTKEGARANDFYNTILDRNCEVDSDNIGWASQLKSGVPESQVIKGFFNSPEYLNKKETATQTVTRLYNSILGREPDKAGLEYWSGLIARGQSVNLLIDQFYNSAEYKAKSLSG